VPGLEQIKKAFGLAKSSRILFRPVPGLVSLKREHGEAITVKVNMNENANKIVRLTVCLCHVFNHENHLMLKIRNSIISNWLGSPASHLGIN